jgi:hypothetical protein
MGEMRGSALAKGYSCQRSFGVIHIIDGRSNCRMKIAAFKTGNSIGHVACAVNKQVVRLLKHY